VVEKRRKEEKAVTKKENKVKMEIKE